MREWAETLLGLTATPWAPLVMVLHAFLESFIMPIPHDVFLITVSLGNPKMSLIYALMSTVASTLGNLVGYHIGKFGGKPLLKRVVKPKTLEMTKRMIDKYDVWATAIAAFTPFPDKIFSLCAGTFHMNLKRFMLVIFFSRAARFYLVSTFLFIYGESVRRIILDYLNVVMIVILVIIIISAVTWRLFLNWFTKREERHV